jgi:hypothetical protein
MKKILKINMFLFPLFLIFASFVSVLESYKYYGFFQKHFLISTVVVYVVSCLSFLILMSSKKSLKKIKRNGGYQFFLSVGSTLFFLSLLVYLILNELDAGYYQNFSFTKFHVQPPNLIFLPVLLIETLVLFIATNERFRRFREDVLRLIKSEVFYPLKKNLNESLRKVSRKKEEIKRIDLVLVGAVVILSFFCVYNLLTALKGFVESDTYIFTHAGATYDEKMEVEWGFLYRLVEVVVKNTPSNSKILFPPFIPPWSVIGNINQFRYFFGDRILVNAPDIYTIDPDADYILIARGGLHIIYDIVKSPDEYGWPKVFIPAIKIWYVDKATGSIIEVRKDYDPLDPANKNGWGLIEVDKSRVGEGGRKSW